MKDINRKVSLLCPLCKNSLFESLDCDLNSEESKTSDRFKCSDCKAIVTKSDLLKFNEGIINSNIDDIKLEVLEELNKDIKKVFK